jgi:hypothetical protein
MAEPRYEIDDEGNLVEDSPPSDGDRTDGESEVTPEQARRFMQTLVLSDIVGVLVLAGGAALLPESRTLLLVLAVAYAIVSVPIALYLRRSIYSRVRR